MSDVETPLERFARLYGTPERGRQLWSQWMETQTPTTQAVMEKVAQTTAEEREITVEEARTFLSLQKLLEDRGLPFAEKFLHEHDLAAMNQDRRLRPLALTRKKR